MAKPRTSDAVRALTRRRPSVRCWAICDRSGKPILLGDGAPAVYGYRRDAQMDVQGEFDTVRRVRVALDE